MIKHITFTKVQAIQYLSMMPSPLLITAREMITPVDELEIDLLMDIQASVEEDSHLKYIDYCYLEPEETAKLVHEYADLL